MKLAKTGSRDRHSTGGVGGDCATQEAAAMAAEEALDYVEVAELEMMTVAEEEAPLSAAFVQTAIAARRRRRVCSCSSQTDVQHGSHAFSPTPGTAGSPTASLLGFNMFGRR